MTRLACSEVTFAYNGKRILDSVDLAAEPGEWVALIGPNGAGKTTLLRIVAGMLSGSGSSRVVIDGAEVTGMTRRDRARHIAVVPQTPVVPLQMPLLDYVLMGRTPFISYWGAESNRDVAKAREMMRRVDLEHFEMRPLGALSGGERQRAVLARALSQESQILLMDEPTTGLDLGHQQRVLDYVDALRRDRGMTVLSAMHDLTLAAQYPDRVVLLDGGRVVALGTPAEVLTSDRLARHFDATVTVLHDEVGGLVIAPRRSEGHSPDWPAAGQAQVSEPSTSDPTT